MTNFDFDFRKKKTIIADEKKGVVVAKKKQSTFYLLKCFQLPLKHYLIDEGISFPRFVAELIDKKTTGATNVAKIKEFSITLKKQPTVTKYISIDENRIKQFYHFLSENDLKPMHFLNYYISITLKNYKYND